MVISYNMYDYLVHAIYWSKNTRLFFEFVILRQQVKGSLKRALYAWAMKNLRKPRKLLFSGSWQLLLSFVSFPSCGYMHAILPFVFRPTYSPSLLPHNFFSRVHGKWSRDSLLATNAIHFRLIFQCSIQDSPQSVQLVIIYMLLCGMHKKEWGTSTFWLILSTNQIKFNTAIFSFAFPLLMNSFWKFFFKKICHAALHLQVHILDDKEKKGLYAVVIVGNLSMLLKNTLAKK